MEKVLLKYVGVSPIRFVALDGSFAGILKPGDTFSISETIYKADFMKNKNYKKESEVK